MPGPREEPRDAAVAAPILLAGAGGGAERFSKTSITRRCDASGVIAATAIETSCMIIMLRPHESQVTRVLDTRLTLRVMYDV